MLSTCTSRVLLLHGIKKKPFYHNNGRDERIDGGKRGRVLSPNTESRHVQRSKEEALALKRTGTNIVPGLARGRMRSNE